MVEGYEGTKYLFASFDSRNYFLVGAIVPGSNEYAAPENPPANHPIFVMKNQKGNFACFNINVSDSNDLGNIVRGIFESKRVCIQHEL